MKIFDVKCDRCEHRWEETKNYEDPEGDCPKCGSSFTRTLITIRPLQKAKDPYDYLDGYRPQSKPIKSFANDRRKGGKDTT